MSTQPVQPIQPVQPVQPVKTTTKSWIPCCGGKRDVAPTSRPKSGLQSQAVITTKQQKQPIQTQGFSKIKQSRLGKDTKQTKPENYAVENDAVTRTKLLTSTDNLSFALDSESGVSNTFDIPYFDYKNLLNHNIFGSDDQAYRKLISQERSKSKVQEQPIPVKN